MLLLSIALIGIDMVREIIISCLQIIALKTNQLQLNDLLQQLKHMDLFVIWILTATFSFMSSLFLYCYFGKRSTESFEEMANCLYESNWTKLPVALQRYYILMIANMQKPLCYHGFLIKSLDLGTFIRVRTILYIEDKVKQHL